MKHTALDYLGCPHCGEGLQLRPKPNSETLARSPGQSMQANGSPAAVAPHSPGPNPSGGDQSEDLKQGELACPAGCGTYPIEQGVPRLLPELGRGEGGRRECQDRTRQSFGAQWDLHQQSDLETTWGVTVEERVDVVLHELNWRPDELRGKVILDAGCGNGTLSAALAERGATVVALDLSESVFRAEATLTHPRLHFVQGNLFFPPLRSQVFDAIYSCGVFHHTPDTRRCFDALVRTLKPHAMSRYFVWLYAKRSRLFNATVEHAMKITRRLPSGVLVPTCVALAGPVEAASRACTAVGWTEDAPRSLRDRAVQLHDLLSPAYVWYHTFGEAEGWAREQGFGEISETSYRSNGNHGTGLAATLEKYRRICRPGFGMLCRSPNGAAESAA